MNAADANVLYAFHVGIKMQNAVCLMSVIKIFLLAFGVRRKSYFLRAEPVIIA